MYTVYREDLEAMIDTSVMVNSSNTQILVSKYHTPIKEPGLLRQVVDFRAGAEEVQDVQEVQEVQDETRPSL